jgi:hypothetical protein
MGHNRVALVVAITMAFMLAGCASELEAMRANRPEDALRGFYTAILRDQDFHAACRFASPDFHLRPTAVLGANINAERTNPKDLDAPVPPPAARRGDCRDLARHIYEKRGDHYPFWAWKIQSVRIAADGVTAEAVTEDGSAGLELVGGQWRVLWALD